MSDHGDGPRGSAVGSLGGPGRRRRAIERDYLATLGEAVTLDDWRDVVRAAVEAAKAGDARARDWLARYLIGEGPAKLIDLAADEAEGIDADRDIAGHMADRRRFRELADLLGSRGLGGP